MATTAKERQRVIDRFDERRDELAESALKTLSERGYAQTSLRDIAQNSAYSHGVVHYYFKDKTELMGYCVRYYKTQCATRYDDIVETAQTAEEFRERFAAKLAGTLIEETGMHRLWYDIRAQGMFNQALRNDTESIDDILEVMIWRILTRYADLSDATILVDAGTAYSLFDGVFEQALLDYHAGRAEAPQVLVERAAQLLSMVLAPAARD